MNRRNFLSTLIGGVATAAAVRTFPFRVFSFPSEIVKPRSVGDWLNLERAPYAGKLYTPHLSDGVPITPEMVRRAIEQMRRAMSIYPYNCIS
jgi:hypothetical protein